MRSKTPLIPEVNADDLAQFKTSLVAEIQRARSKFENFHSAHEGYAVLLEEMDEVKDLVFSKGRGYRGSRYEEMLFTECVQVAAMAFCLWSETTRQERK